MFGRYTPQTRLYVPMDGSISVLLTALRLFSAGLMLLCAPGLALSQADRELGPKASGYPEFGRFWPLDEAIALPNLRPGPSRTGVVQVDWVEASPPLAVEPANHVLNLDEYVPPHGGPSVFEESEWHWQLLPNGLIYRPYVAGRKESRMAGYVVSAIDDTTLWQGTLGGQLGLLRFGNNDPFYPEGLQISVEGAADVQLDIPDEVDVRSVDFRAGVPISYGYGRHRIRCGYYHLSSHLGDEFLLKNPTYPRLNYSRDVLFIGHAYYLTDKTRIYAEAGWAFHSRIAKEWEFQFGFDHAPYLPTGLRGEPFVAAHGHLREELDYGGYLSVQAGWAWVGEQSGNRFRAGFSLVTGESSQYSFYEDHEHVIGFGIWYDQ